MLKQFTKSKKILVVGGGTAGYLTALYVRKLYPETTVTLVEDSNQPPIQVGESGNVLFTQALEFLNIDLIDWSNKTQSLIKLGGILHNWRGDGTQWFHSRVSYYQSLMTNKQTDLEYLKGLITSDIPVYKTLLHGYAFDNKIIPYVENTPYNWPCAMYHFDSKKNADYLKSVAESRGVCIINGKVLQQTKSNNDEIDSVILHNGQHIVCDWIFDCSGLSKVILKKSYNVEYKDLSNYFLARSVITWIEEENIQHKFATDIISRQHGWQWSIDTQRRRGNGYVYSKDFISEGRAIDEIESVLGHPVKIQASFDWDIEYATTVSKKNVIAVGLSAGFLEPLEANGILMIIKTLNAVKNYWNPYNLKVDNDEINQCISNDVVEIIEFLTMHYQCERTDTNFWREFKSDNYYLPYNLKNKMIDLTEFITTDKAQPDFNYSSYSIESWLMILQATKHLNVTKKNLNSQENLSRITNQYSILLNQALSLSQGIPYAPTKK